MVVHERGSQPAGVAAVGRVCGHATSPSGTADLSTILDEVAIIGSSLSRGVYSHQDSCVCVLVCMCDYYLVFVITICVLSG